MGNKNTWSNTWAKHVLINDQPERAQAEQIDCCHALQNALHKSSASNW